jgi:outer membrane beta-barrel protein
VRNQERSKPGIRQDKFGKNLGQPFSSFPHDSGVRLLVRSVAACLLLSLGVGALIFQAPALQAQSDEEFENVEIRVIRPRYMTKRKRFELGTEFVAIMNQTFVYSFLGSGIINYHFTESIGLELTGAYGFSIDKEDKRILDSEFDIQTEILRTKDYLEAAIAWTPIYGKYQLASGRLVYFDTFVTLGGGLTGVEYTYDHCIPPEKLPEAMRASAPAVPAPKTVHYPTVVGGLGQRFFVSKSTSFKWDVKSHAFFYDMKDGDCNPEFAQSQSKNHFNITMQIGASRFF